MFVIITARRISSPNRDGEDLLHSQVRGRSIFFSIILICHYASDFPWCEANDRRAVRGRQFVFVLLVFIFSLLFYFFGFIVLSFNFWELGGMLSIFSQIAGTSSSTGSASSLTSQQSSVRCRRRALPPPNLLIYGKISMISPL